MCIQPACMNSACDNVGRDDLPMFHKCVTAHQFQQEDERVHEDDAVVTTGKVLGLRDASDKGIIPPMWSSSISPRRTSSSRKMSP
jgi:hypothetical protein